MDSVAALITAGGKGTRIMELGTEKPMVSVLGRPMIDHVIDEISKASSISRIYVSVSDNVPSTRAHIRARKVTPIETSGKEYCHDLIQAAEAIEEEHVFICPADLPLIQGHQVDEVVREYLRQGNQSLTVGIPLEKALVFGLNVSFYESYEGMQVIPCGVSTVNRRRMLTREFLPGNYFVTEVKDMAVNVNTVHELRMAEEMLTSRLTSSRS